MSDQEYGALPQSRERRANQHGVRGRRKIAQRVTVAMVSSIVGVMTLSSPSLGVPTRDPGVLMERAYILWAGLCAYCDEPIRLGYGAESAQRPARMHFLYPEIYFDKIKWRRWDHTGSYGSAKMKTDKGRRTASVYFSYPEWVTCRSDNNYNKVARAKLFTRFSWEGGFRRVRGISDSRWYTEGTLYRLDQPDFIVRRGTWYRC